MHRTTALSTLALMAALALPAAAQDTAAPADETVQVAEPAQVEGEVPVADASAADTQAADLLTEAELEELLAPVALYPDTLLVQLLVASTYPLQVVKADQAVQDVADLDEAASKQAIEAKGFDPSVEVLAVAFPSVLEQMADHIDWTETVGDAMLAQSDDVMNAVQVLRQQAIETGALVDTEQQEVSVEETLSTSGEPNETVVIQPTDPQVVYVPQYDPGVVYDTGRYSVGDALLTGAIAWGTYALIDEIFDDDDHWDDYWGCRNCGGWNGQPIIRDPNIDIDVDGNVNIGNRLDIDRDNINIDRDAVNIDRDRIKNEIGNDDIGWKPDPDRRGEARDNLVARRGEGGAATLPARAPGRGDDLRKQLSDKTGVADITKRENAPALRDAAVAAGAAGGAVAGREALKRSSDRGDLPVKRPSNVQKPSARPEIKKPNVSKPVASRPVASKPSVSKPSVSKPNVSKPNVSKPNVKKPVSKPAVKRPTSGVSKPAIKKQASGSRTKAASARAKGGHSKVRR